MNKADRYIAKLIEDILANGYKDENPRPHYPDGTPAYTYSLNGRFRKYDLSKGEFPITTLRPIAWKTGIKEILAIYQNQSNKISEFERCGCGWWKDWELEDGTIGRAYPYNLESHRPDEMKKTIVKVKRKIFQNSDGEINENDIPKFEEKLSIDGVIYLNRYRIIGIDDILTDKKHTYYKIQFISNNYISSMRKDLIGKSNGINPYDRTVYNIGYLGEYQNICNFTQEEITILKDKWESMFFRCYSDRYKNLYKTYDDKFVHHRWHSFENFLKDIRMVPQYFLAREDNFNGWDLDKDYYGSNCYSKESCVFLKHNENTLYAKTNGCYKIIDTTTNQICYEINITEFANKINEQQQTVQKHIANNQEYKNFRFEQLLNDDENVYRYELSRNQLVELLKGLKDNPYGRRHIISFWHWANIDKKSLVECAYETIWNVRNDGTGNKYLDMTLIQRSGDSLVASGGGCVNEVQYAALLMMVARHCGYKFGCLYHYIANEQIYDRHFEQANEMLRRFRKKDLHEYERGHYPTPYMILNPEKEDFYSFTIDDFELIDYHPMQPQLKLELGI